MGCILFNLEEAGYYEIYDYLKTELELSDRQLELAHRTLSNSEFYFFKDKKKINPVWIRSTVFAWAVVFVLLLSFLPFNFIVTGRWGYGKKIKWYKDWTKSLGLL